MAKKTKSEKERKQKKLTKLEQEQINRARKEAKRRDIMFYALTAGLFIFFCVAGVL